MTSQLIHLQQNHWQLTVNRPIYCTTTTSVRWIRNCSGHSEPMTSHALGGLAGSCRPLLHIEQWAARGVIAAILKVWRHIENPTPSMDVYLLDEKSCQISSWFTLKWHNLGFFLKHHPNKKKKNRMMSSNMGSSVPDPQQALNFITLSLSGLWHTCQKLTLETWRRLPARCLACWISTSFWYQILVSNGTLFQAHG